MTASNNSKTSPENFVDIVKSTFSHWLSSAPAKTKNPKHIIESLSHASERLLERKIAYKPIWEAMKYKEFFSIYKKARDDKFFKVLDKETYSMFINYGNLYLKFLKSAPDFQAVLNGLEMPPQCDATAKMMTIKEAAIKVLIECDHAMTADEIYEKIVEWDLYEFGAQNPVNVVRNIIDSACDNSGYSEKLKVAVPCFHFEKNTNGKRIYSLLEKEPSKESGAQKSNVNKVLPAQRMGLTIWDREVELQFGKWIESDGYAPRTAGVYRRAAAQVFRNYEELAQKAIEMSGTALEAVRTFIALLNQDSDFVEVNTKRHNQFSAALSALERFCSINVEILDSNDTEQSVKQQAPANAIAFSLDGIVGLEEGKEGIREILEVHFQALYGYSHINILWTAAQDNLWLFLNDNAINNSEELWRFICRAFSGEYVMSNPHIWKTQPDHPVSYVGVVINLARQFGGIVTRAQIDDYFARIKQGTPINATLIRQGLLMFFAPKQFILTETMDLTNERCSAIRKSIDRLFEEEKVSYVVLRDITAEWFASLPVITSDLDWTALLLQEALRLSPEIGYRVIFSGLESQALDTLGAAIVPHQSDVANFADVVHRHCYENNLLGKKLVTEDLRIILRDAGMLEGNELIYNLHKALRDYRFAFTDENKMVKILER